MPSVYHELSSKRLLVLSFVDGVPLRETPDVPERKEAARQLIESYYRQVLVDGFFHADPHPGNLLWSDGAVYFLDCGMVGEVDSRLRELVLMLVMAFWQEDDEFLAEVVLQLADAGAAARTSTSRRSRARSRRSCRACAGHSLQDIQLGPILQGITEIAARRDVRLPAEMALTAKALAQMQLAASVLDPELDPFSVVGRFLAATAVRARPRRDRPEEGVLRGAEGEVRVSGLFEAVERLVGRAARPALPGEMKGMSEPGEHDPTLHAPDLACDHRSSSDHFQRLHDGPGGRLQLGAGAVRQRRPRAALPDAHRPLLEERL